MKKFKKNIESIIINYNKSKNIKKYIYLKFVQSNSNKLNFEFCTIEQLFSDNLDIYKENGIKKMNLKNIL